MSRAGDRAASERAVEERADSRAEDTAERRRERFLRDFFENSELYTFGIITQKGYKDLEDRLTAHANEVRDRFHRWFVVGLVAYAIIALTSTVALIGFGVLLKQQNKTTDNIQQQRRDFVQDSCDDQNQRHDETIVKLNKAMQVAIKKDPQRREEIRQSSEVSIGLIDALVPKKDCEEAVRLATEGRG